MRYIYKLLYILIIVVIAISSPPDCRTYAQQEEGDILFAKKAFNDGFYALAERKLRSFLEKHPDSSRKAQVHILLGKCFYNQGELKKALYEFQLVSERLDMDERIDEALYWTAEVYFKSQDFQNAIDYYHKLIDEFGNSPYLVFAQYSIGWCYYELKDYDRAMEGFETVLARFPKDKLAVKANYKICEILYEKQEFAKARLRLHSFLKEHALTDKISDAYYMLGDSSFYLGDFKDAVRNLDAALSMSKNSSWIGMALYKKG